MRRIFLYVGLLLLLDLTSDRSEVASFSNQLDELQVQSEPADIRLLADIDTDQDSIQGSADFRKPCCSISLQPGHLLPLTPFTPLHFLHIRAPPVFSV